MLRLRNELVQIICQELATTFTPMPIKYRKVLNSLFSACSLSWVLQVQHNADSVFIVRPDDSAVGICTIRYHVRYFTIGRLRWHFCLVNLYFGMIHTVALSWLVWWSEYLCCLEGLFWFPSRVLVKIFSCKLLRENPVNPFFLNLVYFGIWSDLSLVVEIIKTSKFLVIPVARWQKINWFLCNWRHMVIILEWG